MMIKTRFAPSPTGSLHLGSVRTALYSWLFARKHGGKFILRIEDTDHKRSTQSAINNIIKGMSWLKLDWDEGPYFQTKRLDRYNEVIDHMLSQGTAYKCYCSRLRLEQLRKAQIIANKKPRYDGYCRQQKKYHKNNKTYVVRFCNPQSGNIIFNDLIRGPIIFKNQELDDLIIRRTDGLPTYNFCVVVDDYDMKITHIIRGEDHINNTPRQINIFQALGAPIPKYAHISMIIGNDNKKFSKRHNAVDIMQYYYDGFLPEAILNYLVRLGWSHNNQEIFSINEMKQLFNFNAVSKSTSTFNFKKLLWLNHHYINHLPVESITTQLSYYMKQNNIDICNGPKLEVIVNIFKERCNTLKEIASTCHYLYNDFNTFNIEAANKYLCQLAIIPLKIIYDKLSILDSWTPLNIQLILEQTAKKLDLNIIKINMPLRVAVTGTDKSPALPIILHAIGQIRCLSRIKTAIKFIDQHIQ